MSQQCDLTYKHSVPPRSLSKSRAQLVIHVIGVPNWPGRPDWRGVVIAIYHSLGKLGEFHLDKGGIDLFSNYTEGLGSPFR